MLDECKVLLNANILSLLYKYLKTVLAQHKSKLNCFVSALLYVQKNKG